jgi:hypothetical protein
MVANQLSRPFQTDARLTVRGTETVPTVGMTSTDSQSSASCDLRRRGDGRAYRRLRTRTPRQERIARSIRPTDCSLRYALARCGRPVGTREHFPPPRQEPTSSWRARIGTGAPAQSENIRHARTCAVPARGGDYLTTCSPPRTTRQSLPIITERTA